LRYKVNSIEITLSICTAQNRLNSFLDAYQIAEINATLDDFTLTRPSNWPLWHY